MSEIFALLVFLVLMVAVILYSIRLQRRSVVNQKAVVEIMKKATAQDEETRALLRRVVEINEEILKVLRASRD